MFDLLIGSLLIIVGLLIAGLGGTMSTSIAAVYYIIGFLIAFVGLGFFLKYRKSTQTRD
ncbi:MAG: hypothetical protein ACW98F_16600 [Candidatus Hodarchaeales archaeon]